MSLVFKISALILFMVAQSVAANQVIKDQYPESLLYSAPIEVVPGVWTSIGDTQPPSYENSGQNNNLSFIVTSEGVVVINGSAAYLLAKALDDEIKKITDQPVVLVINENGQGHAMLGNGYWAEQGIPILAHEDAIADFEENGYQALENMQNRNKEKAEGTEVVLPSESFSDKKVITLGGTRIEVIRFGPAHSPGDTSVWLPEKKLVIAGDIAFHERLLPIFSDTIVSEWLETWELFEALGATYVIPGHGHPTNMDQVRIYTKDYLNYLRGKIGTLLEEGGDLAEAYYVDQSPYEQLHTFTDLARRNAGRVYEQMEFE